MREIAGTYQVICSLSYVRQDSVIRNLQGSGIAGMIPTGRAGIAGMSLYTEYIPRQFFEQAPQLGRPPQILYSRRRQWRNRTDFQISS